jgi:hypothetical protein
MRGNEFELFPAFDAMAEHAGLNSRLAESPFSGCAVDAAPVLTQKTMPVMPPCSHTCRSRGQLIPHWNTEPDEFQEP